MGMVVAILIALAAMFVLCSLLPIEGNYTFRIVESGSMEPAIPTGAVVATIPRSTYTPGDVVTFPSLRGRDTVTHRIVGTEANGGETVFVTKGDANEDADLRHVRADEILGKVFLTVPYAGYVARFAATPDGKAVVSVLAIVGIAALAVPWRQIARRKEGNREDEEEQ
jgi:signal peptidase